MFLDGVELISLPVSVISECGKTFYMLTALLWVLKRKAGWVTNMSIESSVSLYFDILFSYSSNGKISV